MLGKSLERECVGGYGMLCVMWVLDEFELKEATKVVSLHKCIKQVLKEFLDVMPQELPDELPPGRQVDHAIEVMPGVAPPTKAPYQMNHEELKDLKVQLEELLTKGYIKPNKSPYVSQPHFGLSVRMRLTLPKVGTWSPPGLPKTQSSIAGVKKPCIGVFFISMERS